MKIKYSYIGVVMLIALALPSCEDKDKQMFTDFDRETAIPLFTQSTEDTGFIDLLDPGSSQIAFTLDKDGLGQVSSIDVTVTYNNSETGSSSTTVLTNVSSFPGSVSLSFNDVLAAFEPEVVTLDSLTLGDSFDLNGAMKMANGNYLNGGYSPSIFTEFPVSLRYNVSCKSEIPLGEYSAVSTATSTDGCPPTNPLVDYAFDVTLTASGVGTYEVSDFFAGVYIDWYGACYGYTFATPASFTDICNNLSFSFADAFGATVEGTGTYDPDTGVITYSWVNDFGDEGTTTLTPK